MKKCAYADRYRGLRYPKCNGGDPCDACLSKWKATQEGVVAEPDDAWAEAFVAGAIMGEMVDF